MSLSLERSRSPLHNLGSPRRDVSKTPWRLGLTALLLSVAMAGASCDKMPPPTPDAAAVDMTMAFVIEKFAGGARAVP